MHDWLHRCSSAVQGQRESCGKTFPYRYFNTFAITQLYHSTLGEWSTSYSRKSGQASRRGSCWNAVHRAKIGTGSN